MRRFRHHHSSAMTKIRLMTIADLPLGLRLSRQAGWNQTQSDWRRFLDLEPQGCFVAERDAVPVGTTTTCVFGPVAWIAMVLVDVSARRKGVGSALLKHALDVLERQAVQTVRLDATATGQHVYEKLGFVPEYALTRYAGRPRRVETPGSVGEATAEMTADLVEFDRRMTGTYRAKMLARLFEESAEPVRVLQSGGDIEGFVTMRCGANAIQIGPCIATPEAGPTLLAYGLDCCAGRTVFIDVPRDHVHAVKLVESSGLRGQRDFMRMYRGEPVSDHVDALWASSGPEKG